MPAKTDAKKNRTVAARELKREKEATAFGNTLWVFGAVVVLEAFFIIGYEQCVKNNYYAVWYQYVLYYGKYLFALLACASAVKAIINTRKGERAIFYIRAAVLCAVVFALLLITFNGSLSTAKNLCVLVPVSGLLLFILFTYQREFFFEGLICALTIITMLSIRKKYDLSETRFVLASVTIALDLIFSLLAYIASKNRGRIRLFGRQLSVFDGKTAVYATLYIACALSAAAAIGGLIFGAGFAYAAICVTGAYLFIAAVFHTVKLM
jgi:hypothetical protein